MINYLLSETTDKLFVLPTQHDGPLGEQTTSMKFGLWDQMPNNSQRPASRLCKCEAIATKPFESRWIFCSTNVKDTKHNKKILLPIVGAAGKAAQFVKISTGTIFKDMEVEQQ